MTTKAGGAATSEAAKTGDGAAGDTSKTGDQQGSKTPDTKTGEQKPGDTKEGKTGDGEQGTKGEQGSKAADGKGSEEGTKSGDGKADESQAPEKYDLAIPDDVKPYVGKKFLERFEAVARASGWSNDDANAELKEAIAIDAEDRKARVEAWTAATKADEDFGGDNLAETTRLANAAIDRVFPEGHRLRSGFLAFLQGGGADQKLEVAAFLATVGRMMGEDRPIRGKQAGAPQAKGADAAQATADSLYDSPTSKKVQEESLRR